MDYDLGTLLIAENTNVGVGLSLIGLAVIGVGIFFMLTPAQHLLQSDRKTARRLYEQELQISGNKERAIAAATFFYRLFGFAFVLFGLVILAFAWLPPQSN